MASKSKKIRELEKQLDELVEYAESRRKGSKVRARYLGYAEDVREQLRAIDH